MTYAEMTLPEFDQEMANTRKVLELVPDDKFDWQATETTLTLGALVNHLADLIQWGKITMEADSFDVHPPGGEMYVPPALESMEEVLPLFDKNVASTREAIAGALDDNIMQPWSLLKQGEPMFTMPRATVVRSFVLNHTIHHRAILITYLRLNGIKVPGMYGPGDADA